MCFLLLKHRQNEVMSYYDLAVNPVNRVCIFYSMVGRYIIARASIALCVPMKTFVYFLLYSNKNK